MPAAYRLDDSVHYFFESKTDATRQECDNMAVSHMRGGKAIPVPIQGMFSYTITAGLADPKLFQFRCEDSTLDMEMIDLATTTHPGFAPPVKYHGRIGQSRPVHVYEMNNLDGKPYILVRDTSSVLLAGAKAQQKTTIKDLARYNLFRCAVNRGSTDNQ